MPTCQPGANPFIEHYFHDCVYNTQQATGFVLGLTAIALWITAQLPQFLDNIKNQSAEALSVWFLAQWFLGDTLNLLGCLLNGEQLATTTALAMYFVLSDVIMLTQFVYYGALQRRKKLAEAKAERRRSLRHFGGSSTQIPGQIRHHHHHHHRHRHSHNIYYANPEFVANPVSYVSRSHSADLVTHSADAVEHVPADVCSPSKRGAALTSDASDIERQGEQLHSSPATGLFKPGVSNVVITATSVLSLTTLSLGPVLWTQHQASTGSVGNTNRYHSTLVSGMHGGNWQATNLNLHDSGSTDDDLPWHQDTDFLVQLLGSFFGYCSTVLYLTSRISQIYKNWQRKSAEGLSVVMFLFTICANMCTGCSILLRLQGMDNLISQLPWIVGAFGTVGLDAYIFYQARYYQSANKMDLLLVEGGGGGGADPASDHHFTITAAATRLTDSSPLLHPLIDGNDI